MTFEEWKVKHDDEITSIAMVCPYCEQTGFVINTGERMDGKYEV